MRKFFAPPAADARREVIVRRCSREEDDYQWVLVSDGACADPQRGSLKLLSEQRDALGDGAEITLLLSADDVSIRSVAISEAELRHHRKLIPYALEDDLADATEALHFAFTRPRDGAVGVAIIRRALLEDYLARFADAGLVLTAVVPELALLPWQGGASAVAILHGGHLRARSGYCDGFDLPLELLASFHDRLFLHQDAESSLQVTILYDEDPGPVPEFDLLESAADLLWQRVDSVLCYLAEKMPARPLNLLQGEYSPPLRWRHLRRQWLPVAAVLVVALALNFTALVAGYQEQKRLAAALKAEQYALAREVLPSGRIVSPQRLLQGLLNDAQTQAPTRFSFLLAAAGAHLPGDSGYAVHSINFDGRTGRLRLDIRAGNLKQIQQFSEAMKSQAVDTKLLTSSARGQGILARLELSER